MKQQSGFSLIEIIVALVILAVGLTGLLAFSTFSIRAARDNDKWTTARIIAASQQEALSSRDFTSLQALANSPGTATGTNLVKENGETYTVKWTLDRGGHLASDPLEVRVEVSYPNMVGKPVTLRTYRYTLL